MLCLLLHLLTISDCVYVRVRVYLYHSFLMLILYWHNVWQMYFDALAILFLSFHASKGPLKYATTGNKTVWNSYS